MLLNPARFGFDESKITFAIRTSLAACLALLIAWCLGLDHPQWAAMSVWAASQPLRQQLLAKGAFRVAGTLVGTTVGVVLVMAWQVSPWALVLGLSAWCALCTWGTNLQRGYLAYGTVLAGYTAAMVALVDIGNSENILALGADRLATVLLGVTVATLAGLIFGPRNVSGAGLRASVRGLIADLLERMAAQIRKGQEHSPDSAMIARIAGIEEGLDSQFPGARRETRSTRAILIAAMAVLLQRGSRLPAGSDCADLLSTAAQALRTRRIGEAIAALSEASERALAHAPGVGEALGNLSAALQAWQPKAAALKPVKSLPVMLHRDWIGARQAALRAGIALFVTGAFWQLSGWSSGQFMLLGLSIMITLFSTFESPAQMMKPVILGQICAIAAVFICRWLLWPHLQAEWQLVLSLMPFILLGSLLVAHSRTGAISFDYNMVFLLLMQPSWPLSGSPEQTALMALAVILGPVTALAMYWLIFPTSLRSRRAVLRRMMQRDLMDLAAESDAWASRNSWRARLYHRTLRLIRLQERSERRRDVAVKQAEDSLRMGHQILQLHRRLSEGRMREDQRICAREALDLATRMDREPRKAAEALAKAALFTRTLS